MGHGGPGEVNNKNQHEAVLGQPLQAQHALFSRFRSIARSYFRKAHGVLLLYDVTSESSFLSVRAWVDQIQVTVERWHAWPYRRGRDPFQLRFPPQDSTEDKLPMCVVGNKVDLREQRPEGSCVSTLQGEKLAKVRGDFPPK